MNLKNLLLSVAVIAATPLFATTYYVTPEGAGAKDGSSWENAFGVEEFRTKAAANTNRDVYNFAGGVYTPSETIVFRVGTGAILNGNTDGERTIFSGDKNGNNNPGDGDMNRLIRFQANTVDGNNTNKIEINNLDFTCVYTYADSDSGTFGALMIDNSGDVIVNNCKFYANWAQGQQGGAAAHLYRSTVTFKNCEFSNNSANYKGGAVRLRSNDKNKGITTFESCVFKNNKNYHNYGGAIYVNQAKALNILNTTFYNNQVVSDGAAIYIDGQDDTFARNLTIVNSTIAGNTITGENQGGQISSTQSANIHTANSIIVSNNENTADFFFNGTTPSEKFSFVSGGYNYVGSIIDAAETATRAEEETSAKINWLDTDNVSAKNTYASIFGENKINSDNVIVPVKYFAGASGTQVEEAVKEWGLPADVDVTTDQNGTERTEGMMPGAYAITQKDIDGTTVSVINVIDDAANAPRLVKVANGVYTVEGATEGVTAYTVNGATVAATSGNTIDLSSFANGLYIIKSGNAIFKVMK